MASDSRDSEDSKKADMGRFFELWLSLKEAIKERAKNSGDSMTDEEYSILQHIFYCGCYAGVKATKEAIYEGSTAAAIADVFEVLDRLEAATSGVISEFSDDPEDFPTTSERKQ